MFRVTMSVTVRAAVSVFSFVAALPTCGAFSNAFLRSSLTTIARVRLSLPVNEFRASRISLLIFAVLRPPFLMASAVDSLLWVSTRIDLLAKPAYRDSGRAP